MREPPGESRRVIVAEPIADPVIRGRRGRASTVGLLHASTRDRIGATSRKVSLQEREISEVASTADSLRVAVLTALHLAQEIRELKKQYEDSDVLIQTKTNEWSRTLESVLKK